MAKRVAERPIATEYFMDFDVWGQANPNEAECQAISSQSPWGLVELGEQELAFSPLNLLHPSEERLGVGWRLRDGLGHAPPVLALG